MAKSFKKAVTKEQEILKLLGNQTSEYVQLNPNLKSLSMNGTNLNVLHLNIRSFLKNKDSLVLLLEELANVNLIPDVIVLCETFLNDFNVNLAKILGYNTFSKYRVNTTGGGVSILVDRTECPRM